MKIVCLLALFYSGLAMGQCNPASPATPQSSLNGQIMMPPAQWQQWLRQVDHLPSPPHYNEIYRPMGVVIDFCNSGDANYCVNTGILSGADPGLGTINEPDDRIQFLRMYATHYNIPNSPAAVFSNLFTSGYVWNGSPGADIIKDYAGKIRYYLYKDLNALNCQKSLLTSSNSDRAKSMSLQSIIVQLQRQVKLVDLMFPDAAAWQMLMVQAGVLPP